MPCFYGGPTYEQTQEQKRVSAALRAVLSILEEHKRAIRKEREAKFKEQEAEKQLVLPKLTPDERRALRL